jgi:superoxide dismutase, Cu-Zn family
MQSDHTGGRSVKLSKTRYAIAAQALAGLLLLSTISAPVAAETAVADIYSCLGEGKLGQAVLNEEQTDQGIKVVTVVIKLEGLSPGEHGVHIHETAACEPCGAAGGHFDPGPNGDSNPDGNHPFHSGDLVNITVGGNGKGKLKAVTTRVTLSPGPLSVFDSDGSAFVIHNDPDTFCPDGAVAGCAGGGRAACGIIDLM